MFRGKKKSLQRDTDTVGKDLLNLCFCHVYLFTLVIHGSLEGRKSDNDTRHKTKQVAVEKFHSFVIFFPHKQEQESENLLICWTRAAELTLRCYRAYSSIR